MKVYSSETYKEEQAEEDYELKGEDIDYFYTIGSWYNNGCIGVVAQKRFFMLRVEELNKIKDGIRFKINLASDSRDKRRTIDYLQIIED
jgi:hypothetical protein